MPKPPLDLEYGTCTDCDGFEEDCEVCHGTGLIHVLFCTECGCEDVFCLCCDEESDATPSRTCH